MTSVADHFQTQRKDDKFREYKPYSRGNAARITDEQWEPYLPLIACLHNARRTRTQILEVLREHGLEPSLAQLYAKMARWGLKGYASVHHNEKEATDTSISCTASVQEQLHPDVAENSSGEDSAASSDWTNCFSRDEVDTSDTVYDTEDPSTVQDREKTAVITRPETPALEAMDVQPSALAELVRADASPTTVSSTDVSSLQSEVTQKLPADLMAFVQSTVDLSEFDKHDILNDVASFLCATSSFSDAFVLFDTAYKFLKAKQCTPMALVFATINCLRSATFKEQCQFAGALMGEALAALRLLSHTNPYAATALSSLEEIGRELCVKSELEYLNILYTQMRFREAAFSTDSPSRSTINEVLLHCSDPFQLVKMKDSPEALTHSLDVSGMALGRIVGKLGRWCCTAVEDFNPISMLPSAGFNPSDPVSVARFATALSCHFIRKWSFLSLAEVLAHCNELLPPNRKDAAARLCKLAVRVLSTLAVYTIYQATGMTLRSVSDEYFFSLANQAQYLSPLANHLDVLARMGSRERVLVFAEMHKTLYNRTLVYRQQLDDHCLTAHVRETGFLLAASLIRLKRELNMDVPQPAPYISRSSTPVRDRDSHSPSRKSRDSSSSMQNLATRNLMVPGMMSKNGSHVRKSWIRRLSTDSNDSWNFTKVTGLPAGPMPSETVVDQMQCDDEAAAPDQPQFDDGVADLEMTDTNTF